MKKLGFFGGTFDPIHLGHLNLAVQLKEAHGLDEVLFCPAFCSPFKGSTPPLASPEERYEMVRLATQPFPFFGITRWEIEREGPSYTIETIRALKKDSQDSFHLLLSDEEAPRFLFWKEAFELLKLAPPLIGRRVGGGVQIPEELKKGFTETPLFDISSTVVRERIAKKLPCAHLVPLAVLDYILDKKIYLCDK